MAKARYHKWLEQDGLTLLKGWARDGLTDEQIAHNMGISARTLERWKNDHCQICQALKEGKEVVDYLVENALLQAAMDGNVTAQIFWLKNRRRKAWKDKPEDETKQQTNVVVTFASEDMSEYGD